MGPTLSFALGKSYNQKSLLQLTWYFTITFNPFQSISLAQSHNPGEGNILSLTRYLYLIHQIVSPKQLLMEGNITMTYADAE